MSYLESFFYSSINTTQEKENDTRSRIMFIPESFPFSFSSEKKSLIPGGYSKQYSLCCHCRLSHTETGHVGRWSMMPCKLSYMDSMGTLPFGVSSGEDFRVMELL